MSGRGRRRSGDIVRLEIDGDTEGGVGGVSHTADRHVGGFGSCTFYPSSKRKTQISSHSLCSL